MRLAQAAEGSRPKLAAMVDKRHEAVEVDLTLSTLDSAWKARPEAAQAPQFPGRCTSFPIKSNRRRVGTSGPYTVEIIGTIQEDQPGDR